MASISEKYRDELPEDLDDYYYGSSGESSFDTSEVVIDTRSLEKDTSGLKKIGSYKTAKDYFAALEKYIRKLGTASMNRAFARVVPDILEGYVRYNQDLFGYNDYLGGLIHGYYARLFIGGRQVLLCRVNDNISLWGKAKKNKNGKLIFRLMRRRHAIIKHYKNWRWHTPRYENLHNDRVRNMPTFNEKGQRLKWMDRELNWRGRRLKGKKGGKFRYRVKYNSVFGKSDYVYNYYYGRKRGIKGGVGSMTPYFKKILDKHPYDKVVKRGAYRYANKIDRLAPGGYKKYVLSSFQARPRAKTTMEIFNAAPYSRRLARLGYPVLPAIKVRDGWKKQIATMMRKDFDRFLK